ncbi:MAG: hypothetical protein LC130_36160 [Bryobacterales bacterium]|nr:hypothetical protein [Bryobacterales bacterium]
MRFTTHADPFQLCDDGTRGYLEIVSIRSPMILLRFNERLTRLPPNSLAVASIVAAFGIAGILTGYVIASGRPIPIALVLGVIGGIAMLNTLPIAISTVLIGVLLLSGPLFMFLPALEKGAWLFSVMGFFLTGAAMLYATVGRERFLRPPPPFVGMAIVLLAAGLLSIAYSDGPLMEGVRAGKRYFQFFGLLFIFAVVPFPASLVRRWWGFLLAVALLQLPFALFQRLVLVPMREGMPDVVPIDIVVGTMEGNLNGAGSSSVMVLFLSFMLFYLLAAVREGVVTGRRFALLAAILAVPFALGEVNLIVVLLPLALAASYQDLIRRQPFRIMLAAALALPLLGLLGWIYLSMQAGTGQPLDLKLEEIISYNFGQAGYYGRGLNRTSVYAYWMAHQSISDPIGFVFGHGLGSSFGSITELNPGHMDRTHAGMFIGLTTASSVLWDLGVVGLLLILSLFLSAIRYAYRLTLTARPGFDRAFCRALYVMALMLFVMLFYSDAAISVPSQEVLAAFTLGLIAWRWRWHSAEQMDLWATDVLPENLGKVRATECFSADGL